jgi:hypothetical protein
MFNDIFDGYFEKLKPTLNDGVTTIQAYAERVIARLDDIVDAVQSDETLNVRRVYTPALSAAAGLSQEIAQVPTDQDWHLETVTIDTDAGTTIRISPGSGSVANWGVTVSAAGVTSAGGNGAIFPGGSPIVITSSAGVSRVYLQFRYERRKAKRRATHAGVIVQSVTGQDARTESSEEVRHKGTAIWAGNNVIGERHNSEPI